MVFQLQEETWFYNQEIQGTILCERGCPEETVSQTLELIFSSGTMGHSEADVYFSVYYRFTVSKYRLHKCLLLAYITSEEPVFDEFSWYFKSDGG